MKILKTAYVLDAVSGHLLKCDTIEFGGKFWLVPLWIENHATGKMRPERIICLDCLPHQQLPQVAQEDFVLHVPIPKCVFDGKIPDETAYNFEIVENPEIDVYIPKKLH
ncbi:MAG: hypothetical protein V1766_10900 [Pseudomonadota bacterium]